MFIFVMPNITFHTKRYRCTSLGKPWWICKFYSVFEYIFSGIPLWLRGWRLCLQCRRPEFDPWVRKIPWRRKWHPTPVFLPGKSHEWRSLAGYSPQGRKESVTSEWLHFHFSLFSVLIPNTVCHLKMCHKIHFIM